ncbi:hypothetical protein [Bacillus alkalicellulosilyticus]|uniref:hypothetical protein n=1 Tax=Alkalihalobacterium alkalicellulosilyticum TaxID=1912214 RepID=UPI0009976222|nr:hypothetical protein [Bacillus alkalicellulosilyticus]
MKKKVVYYSFLVFLVGLLAACGGSGNEAINDENSDNLIVIEASNWDFNEEEYTVTAGSVTIELKNVDGYHGIEIRGTNVKINGDGKSTVTLEPGEYEIYCSIPCGGGHDEMIATLIVV